ncbi:MAG: serine/threonine-protein kinase [Anaeromyxobacter sp.]
MAAPAPAPGFDAAKLVGTVLDGRYALTGHIATGGMGAVFRAQHVHLRKQVAVKLLRPELSSAPDLVERFRREAEIASHLEHENIVKVTDFGRSAEGLLFLVMELLEGESLFDRLRREGPMSPDAAVPVLQQICAGLEAAHALGVVHRDLKPENVFLAQCAGGREVTKILDFGIAKLAIPGSPSATQAGMVVGTPEYLSPEQAMGVAVDSRADLYTVGILAFRALTGRHPFQGADQRALLVNQASSPVPRLPEGRPELAGWPRLVGAVEAACRKDPAQRPQTAAALGALFARGLEQAAPERIPPPLPSPSPLPVPVLTPDLLLPSPEPAQPPPAPVAAPRPPRRPRRRALAWTLAAVAAAALAWVGLVQLHRVQAASHARALLEGGRAEAALAEVDEALQRRAADPELLLLRARALGKLPGRAPEALDAYAAAAAAGPLGAAALDEVASWLGRERSLADRAARVLREAGPEAVAPVAARARQGEGLLRLRALFLLRDLGAEDAVDRTALYASLLDAPSCDLRRAAAQRLGELADPAALPALRLASQLKVVPVTGGKPAPSCGAPEADEAVRRIEAAQSQAKR